MSHLLTIRQTVCAMLCFFASTASHCQHGFAQSRITPERELQNRWEFDPDLGALWFSEAAEQEHSVNIESLKSNDLQSRVQAMQTATLLAGGQLSNRGEAFQAVLAQLAADLPNQTNRQAIQAMVSAAAKLATSLEEVEQVWKVVGHNGVGGRVIEPRLVYWKSRAALEVWRQRVSEGAAKYGDLFTALDGITAVGSESDREALESLLTRTGTLMPIQVAASKALGAVVSQGLEQLAGNMLDSTSAEKELLAANLLANHTGPVTEQLFERIIGGENPNAQLVAYRALAGQNPQRGRELAGDLLSHPENNLRRAAVEVLDRTDDEKSLNQQAMALADQNVNLRKTVRGNLRRKASVPALAPLVDDIIGEFINSDRWEGIEQAITLAAELEKSDRADSIIALLDHPNPEVNIRAAWSLQMLDLEPESLESIIEHCRVYTQQRVADKQVSFDEEVRVAFCFEALGRHAYQPANEMLMVYVPKNGQKMGKLTRTSAIYALGHIWTGQKNPALLEELARRMHDQSLTNPEPQSVKYVCAITIGRNGDKALLPEIESLQEHPASALGLAGQWAMEQLSGPNR